MESTPTPRDAAAQLADAEEQRSRFATTLRLPPGFHTALGAAVAVQMATAAFGIGAQTGAGLAVLLAGCLLFVVVTALLVHRFRSLNGVWVGALLSRSVLGLTTAASWAYGAPFAAAVWAALGGLPWVTVVASLVGGAAYALVARRWWAAYVGDPVTHARHDSATLLGTVILVVVAGAAVLGTFALSR
jgi:hypothetical protein